MEDNKVRELTAEGEDRVLEKDAVAREIMMDAESREKFKDDEVKQRSELEASRQELYQKEEEMAAVRTREILAKNPDPNLDIDQVYDEVLTAIQNSRKDKLGAKSLGVLANTIQLEEAREYSRKAKEEKETQKEANEEAIARGFADGDNLDAFFEKPEGYNEVKMYQSIVRSIIEKRPPSLDTIIPKATLDDDLDDEDGDEDDDGESSDPGTRFSVEDEEKKWKLTAKETVESYRLLNLWREMESARNLMESSLGEKKDRSSNKIQPLFLSIEDSEETRREDAKEFAQVLQLGLKTDDDVEKSSNELLMKELLEGGVNKERSLRLVEKLINKATDDTIKEALNDLKATLMEKEEVSTQRPQSNTGPIDLSKVLLGSGDEPVATPRQPPKATESEKTLPQWVEDEKKLAPPPSTAFFQAPAEDEPKAAAPPKPAFFQSIDEDSVESDASTVTGDKPFSNVFGSYEEQKFQSIAKQMGANTEEEKAELRRNLDELKEIQNQALGKLDDEDFDVSAESAKLGVDVNSLNFDAEDDDQIMSIIGKRSGLKNKGGGSEVPPVKTSEVNESKLKKATLIVNEDVDDIIVGSDGKLKKMNVDKKIDIAGDRYRAISAGMLDKETRDKDEAAFRDFLKREEEMEKQLDAAGDETLPEDFDINAYADDIMSEIKPRPQIRKRKDFMSQEQLDDEKKKKAIFGDDEVVYDKRLERDISPDTGMPDWLRMEQEERGGTKAQDLDDDDEFDTVERQMEIEERQKKADEYLKKKSGGAIDIADVLGREYFGPMDDSEDNYELKYSTFSSFEARKEELLQYTELTVEDVNNVVDYKIDPSATGYSSYLPKIQRPFSEYGAIFRLEGVMVDMIGMQVKAWRNVAEKYKYQIYSEDDLKQASLYKAENAVRKVFGWTDDIIELEEISKTHLSEFNAAFNTWLEGGRSFVGSTDEVISPLGDVESNHDSFPSDDEMNAIHLAAWSKLADNIGKTPPTKEEIERGVETGDWEIAVRDVFGWSDYTDEEIYAIVVDYDDIFQEESVPTMQRYGIATSDEQGNTNPDVRLQDGVKEWL